MVLNPVEEYIFCLSGITFVPSQVRNKKVRRYVSSMRKKDPVPFSQKFPNADPLGVKLLEKLLVFEPKDCPTAEEVVISCYFVILISWFLLSVCGINLLYFYGVSCNVSFNVCILLGID